MKRNKNHLSMSLKRPASPCNSVPGSEDLAPDGRTSTESPSSLLLSSRGHGPSSNCLNAPQFLLPSAIVRLDRSTSSASLHLTEAYRGNPYDIQAIRRRSEPTSQVISALKNHHQAAGHPEYEMEYEEQPLDMSIKGKFTCSSSNSGSSSSPPILESTPMTQSSPSSSHSPSSFLSQITRPSVITCAPSLKVKSTIGSTCSNECCSTSLKCTRHHHHHQHQQHHQQQHQSNIPSTIGDHHQLIPNCPGNLMSNGHSQDTIIANETAKLNIYCDSSESASLNADPVDEHFRRSLGKDFTEIFKSPSVTTKSVASSKCATKRQPHEQPSSPPTVASASLTVVTTNGNENCHLVPPTSNSTAPQVISSVTSIVTEMSTDVDDHFAKALGADWLKKLKTSDATTKRNQNNSRHQENGFNG